MAEPSVNNNQEAFERQREHILSQPYLDGIDTEEVKQFLAGLPENRFASKLFSRQHDLPYIQPRGGFSTYEKQLELTQTLDTAGADFIPLTIDSYTRHKDHDRAQILLEQSEDENRDLLNGYPLVNHGFEVTRTLFDNIDKPVSLRHGTPDARMLVEIAIASGLTEIEGGGLSYCLPYSSDFPLDKAIIYWQYVDRLCAVYSTADRPIHRELFGALTATMVPPVITICVSIIELLLAVEQGVTSISVGIPQSGSLIQDFATTKVMRDHCRKWLNKFGFYDVTVSLVYHQWMGAFPSEKRKADYLIAIGAVISRLIRADKIVTKTREEAHGVPTAMANASAVKEVKYVLEKMPFPGYLENKVIVQEAELIEREVNEVLETVFRMPGKSLWYSFYEAVRKGIIDVPFAPNKINSNKLLTARDRHQSIRIYDPGNLPLSKELVDLEKNMLEQTALTGKSIADKMLEDIFIML